VALVGLVLAVSPGVRAQAVAARVGLLAQDLQPGLLETLQDQLQQLGYQEGRNLVLEVRTAGGQADRLPALADELVRLKVSVLVAVNTPAAKAAKRATTSVPIVIMRVADPVGQGLVTSLSHPGSNVTGLSFMPDELGAKGVQLLREVLPRIRRVGSLYKADNPGALVVVKETEHRSVQLGLQFLRFPVRDPADFTAAFETATRAGTEALFVMDDGAITKHRQQLAELAIRHSLALVSIYRDFAEAGGLIAYGPRLSAVYRRGAVYVDRILRGAKPADLPVEQPTEFDFTLNLRTARVLGLTIPPALLLRADHVLD
jgi:putative ABC transport system substrate-binding protein